MIPRSTPSRIACLEKNDRETVSWQALYADCITEPSELALRLGLPDSVLNGADAASGQFRLRIPRSFLPQIQPGDPDDPVLKQFLPTGAETVEKAGYVSDPVGDLNAMPTDGLLHKYEGRVLLMISSACAVHCRYCFRRNFPYDQATLSQEKLQQALHYISMNSSIHEVILSGGDPLSVSDEKLNTVIQQLEAIPHVQRLRFHTRLPVIIPQRITNTLMSMLEQTRLNTVLVTHINHPNEISEELKQALQNLRNCNITLLNQSVLLRGINDNIETLQALSEKLFSCGVLQYYLHMLDKASGTSHFEVDEKTALDLHQGLSTRLGGYLVPKLVRETEGKPCKVSLNKGC